MFRVMLRESGIFRDPGDPATMVSLGGKQLHSDLENFHFNLVDNYEKYKNDVTAEFIPVFITAEDPTIYDDIITWKIENISGHCLQLIDTIKDND